MANIKELTRRVTDANGDPVSGATAEVYEAGTSTPVSTATLDGMGTPSALPWPIVANSEGQFPSPVVVSDGLFKLIVKDSDGTVLQSLDWVECYGADDVAYETGSFAIELVDGNSVTVDQAVTGLYTKFNTDVFLSIPSVWGPDTTGMTNGEEIYLSLPFTPVRDMVGSFQFDTGSGYAHRMIRVSQGSTLAAFMEWTDVNYTVLDMAGGGFGAFNLHIKVAT